MLYCTHFYSISIIHALHILFSQVMYHKTFPSDHNIFYPTHLHRYMHDTAHFSWCIAHAPEVASFAQAAQETSAYYSAEKRTLLHTLLTEQYTAINGSHQAVRDNIHAIQQEKSFTITTGQQIHIFLWPLFVATKILDCIALAQEARQTYPESNRIPVFWMASEDHDFAEINHVDIYKQRYTRNHTQQHWPVGRWSPDDIQEVLKEIAQRLDDSPENKTFLDICSYAYTTYTSLAQATHYIIDQLFGHLGLIVIDADDPRCKASMHDIFSQELFTQATHTALEQWTQQRESLWYKAQAHPREINLFYMTDSQRSRIIYDSQVQHYVLVDTWETFSQEEMKKELKKHPERFSPNVFLRALYQEHILPNICYVAGPSECIYRLQMKPMFDLYKIPFPVVLPRTLTHYLSKKNHTKIEAWPLPQSLYVQSKKGFLAYIQQNNASIYEQSQSFLTDLTQRIETFTTRIHEQGIHHKQAQKSLSTITRELDKMAAVISSLDQQHIEKSMIYQPYLKIKDKFFDPTTPFERMQFIVWHVALTMTLLHMPRTREGKHMKSVVY